MYDSSSTDLSDLGAHLRPALTYPHTYQNVSDHPEDRATRDSALSAAYAAIKQAATCATPPREGARADYRGAQAWAAISQAWSAYAAVAPDAESEV